MRYLYTVVIHLLVPFILLRLLLVSCKNPDYRKRWLERFGIVNWKNEKSVIWIHAVSVGEANAAKPIVKKLSKNIQISQFLLLL